MSIPFTCTCGDRAETHVGGTTHRCGATVEVKANGEAGFQVWVTPRKTAKLLVDTSGKAKRAY